MPSIMKFFKNTFFIKILKLIFTIFFIAYLSYLVYLTFFSKLYGRTLLHRSINIIPFKTIILFLTSSYNYDIIVTNIAGNIAAFIPMGFLLPLVFNRLSTFVKVFLTVLIATASIEILQYITGVGATDIDDIILNAIGGIAGYLTCNAFMKVLKFFHGGKSRGVIHER